MGPVPSPVLTTERLRLRHLAPGDAGFMVDLLNQPSFLQNVGDRGVRVEADAVAYIQDGPRASYARFGFGMYLVELKASGHPIGICGLLQRDTLPHADLGFAFLPEFWSQGYALESAAAVRRYAGEVLGLRRLLAVTLPGNRGSTRLLERLGFEFDRMIRLEADGPDLMLYSGDT